MQSHLAAGPSCERVQRLGGYAFLFLVGYAPTIQVLLTHPAEDPIGLSHSAMLGIERGKVNGWLEVRYPWQSPNSPNRQRVFAESMMEHSL
jgi:hypothetical protein